MRDASIAPGPARTPEKGPSWRPPRQARRLLVWGAYMSVLAAMLHAQVAPEHWQEWWGYGLFFVVSAVAQLAYGLLLLLFAIHLEVRLPRWARSEKLFYGSGIVGNVALIALYFWTRTVGNFAGPATGEVEPVEIIGVISKAAEVALVAMLVVALWKGGDAVERRRSAATA